MRKKGKDEGIRNGTEPYKAMGCSFKGIGLDPPEGGYEVCTPFARGGGS